MKNNYSDPLDFIDSDDIRSYLKNIGYKPGLLESAFFIYQSKIKTIKEKHQAWTELIQNTDDLILDEKVGKRWANTDRRTSLVYGKSAHELIRKHMDDEKTILEFLRSDTENTVYVSHFESWLTGHGVGEIPSFSVDEAKIYFSSFDEANNYCLKMAKKEPEDITGYRISKYFISYAGDEHDKYVRASFNQNGEAVSVDMFFYPLDSAPEPLRRLLYEKEHGIDATVDFFENMWFDIPIPFKEGDIVCAKPYGWGMERYPFVLRYTVPWGMKRRVLEGKEYREGSDSSDMNASGWTIGFGDYKDEIYDDVMADYLNLEYYREEYRGKERLLPLLAEMIKGNLDIWEYERIKAEIIRTSGSDYCKKYMLEKNEIAASIVQGKPTWSEA